MSGQLLVVEAARVSQTVVVGFSSQLDAQLHHLVLQGPRGPQQGVIYLVTDLCREHVFSMFGRLLTDHRQLTSAEPSMMVFVFVVYSFI